MILPAWPFRKVTPAGVMTTLARLAGRSGNAYARFGVAVDSGGNVYVVNTDNATIRKVTPGEEITTIAGLDGGISRGGAEKKGKMIGSFYGCSKLSVSAPLRENFSCPNYFSSFSRRSTAW